MIHLKSPRATITARKGDSLTVRWAPAFECDYEGRTDFANTHGEDDSPALFVGVFSLTFLVEIMEGLEAPAVVRARCTRCTTFGREIPVSAYGEPSLSALREVEGKGADTGMWLNSDGSFEPWQRIAREIEDGVALHLELPAAHADANFCRALCA